MVTEKALMREVRRNSGGDSQIEEKRIAIFI